MSIFSGRSAGFSCSRRRLCSIFVSGINLCVMLSALSYCLPGVSMADQKKKPSETVKPSLAEPEQKKRPTESGRPGSTEQSAKTYYISNSFGGSMYSINGNNVPFGWGKNDFMQALPKNSSKEVMIPVSQASLVNAKEFATGGAFTIMLKTDGKVLAWGNNQYGQLGNGGSGGKENQPPEPVRDLDNVVHIAAGEAHSVALKSDGTVWVWGRNMHGQMGDGSAKPFLLPRKINGVSDVKAIATRGEYILALRNDGTVWGWGDNHNGQLGNGTKKETFVPSLVRGITNVTAIAAGGNHAVALRSDGSVWTWGLNSDGQLGNGQSGGLFPVHTLPVPVVWITEVVAIGAGEKYVVAIRRDGTVWAWGDNSSGQLGNGTDTESHNPLQVEEIRSARSVSCSAATTFVSTSDNLLYAFGDGTLGQLGGGSKMKVAYPVKIVFPAE